jgi:GTP-binding protein HflX
MMRALIISVNLGAPDHAAHAEEFDMLAKGAGAEVVATLIL